MAGGSVALWAAVFVSGLYHGISPGMGWPLAVSAALFERRAAALFRALLAIGLGHLAAIALVLLPFATLHWLVGHTRLVRMGAGLLVMGFGLLLLVRRRHPRALARIRPDRLLLWAFVVAIAHGAGLMIVPIYLGMTGNDHPGHAGLASHGLPTLLAVSVAHTVAMVAGGGALAWLVYRYLGLQFLRKSWFNLDRLWALSLILVGAAGAWSALD